MLPKVHLTSHSWLSGSRWVITLSWLSGLWRSFMYSSVYSCHPLISSASVRSLQFLSFIEPIFAWNVPLVSLIFLTWSLVFDILLFPSISLHWGLVPHLLNLPQQSISSSDSTPLQYSCLEYPTDGGAWSAAVHGVAKRRTWLSNFTFTFHFHTLEKDIATHSSALAWRIPGTGKPWRAAVYGIAQSRTWLKWLSSSLSNPGNQHWCNAQRIIWISPVLQCSYQGMYSFIYFYHKCSSV